MKLSKKVLSMVLCGLVVLGGSQAALVKANAQTVIAGSSLVDPAWKQEIRFGMQSKAGSGIKSGWSMELVFKNGHLKLDGRTNVGCTWTFGDTFKVGWEKTNGQRGQTIFRTSGASAADALGKVKSQFNNADIGVGDKVYFYGEKWDTSLTFPNSRLIIKGITGNDYSKGYNPRAIDKTVAGFCVYKDGLHEAIVHHG